MKYQILKLTRRSGRGDTIVEVLIAIAIAAFAIGTSYAIANRSLEHAISARERNEALTIIDSQIADLKARYKYTYFSDPATFNTNFAAAPSVNGPPWPASSHHFCLIDSATDPAAANWLPADNNFSASRTVDTLSNPPYAGACIRHNPSTDYYIDIAAEVTASSANSFNRTVYEVAVRWAPVGGGQNNQAVIYYRF